jgi:hypothetical protein
MRCKCFHLQRIFFVKNDENTEGPTCVEQARRLDTADWLFCCANQPRFFGNSNKTDFKLLMKFF